MLKHFIIFKIMRHSITGTCLFDFAVFCTDLTWFEHIDGISIAKDFAQVDGVADIVFKYGDIILT